MIRVLIADDHPVVRKGLIQILCESADIQVVAEATSAQQVLDRLANASNGGTETSIDVVVMDVGMPGRSGLEVLPDIHRDYPKLPVLILSQYPAEQIAVRAIKTGAAGYLNKEGAPEQLVAAVVSLSQGRRYLTDEVAELLASTIKGGFAAAHEALSNRELDVLRLIASGKTVSEIAESMNLSVKTISTYRTRILQKMSLSTNAALTTYAIRNGIVQ